MAVVYVNSKEAPCTRAIDAFALQACAVQDHKGMRVQDTDLQDILDYAEDRGMQVYVGEQHAHTQWEFRNGVPCRPRVVGHHCYTLIVRA